MIKHLGLKAYGKVNLGLDVVRRREDGYHEVRMIMQTVGIYDRIDLMRREQPGIGIETNLYYLPDNENNLAYKAARLLMDEFDIKEGVNIRIKKFIPVAVLLMRFLTQWLRTRRQSSLESTRCFPWVFPWRN